MTLVLATRWRLDLALADPLRRTGFESRRGKPRFLLGLTTAIR